VTGQPAVHIGLFGLVTFYALTHAPLFSLQAVRIFNFPMAGLAHYLTVDMPLVVEQDVFGQLVDFHPGRRRLGVVIFVLFLNPWMVGNDVLVTVQAFFHRRQTGVIGIIHIGVTESTLDLFYAAMHGMAEGYGLFGPETDGR
jgi:hypothetical protein